MTKAKDVDKVIILATIALVAIGLVMIYSTSYIMAMKRYGSEYFFVKKHILFIILGLWLFFIASKIKYHIYRRWIYLILFSSLALLMVLTFIPEAGSAVGGAKRWIEMGPFTFQPSEPAKLAVVIYLAYFISAKQDKIKTFSRGFLPPIIMSGFFIVLILNEPDFGTAISLGAIVVIMLFIGGVRIRHLFLLFLFAIPLIYLMITKIDYRMKRVLTFLDPWKDSEGAGFQLVQSLLAFGAGGIRGVGLGEGKQKLFYLPEAHTDFILSVVAEELGLIGVSSLIVLYLIILIYGVRIALRTEDLFGKYLAVGITLLIVLQAAINMAVVTALLPTKGLTLPFISYGGTSFIVNMIGVGILLNVYKTEIREQRCRI